MIAGSSASSGVLEVFTRWDGNPVEDLAFEGWLLERAAAGSIALSCTSWSGPVVVLGYGQKPDDVDLELCRGRRLPVLRRLTGGTGVVHAGDLSVSLALPIDHPWATGIVGLYGRILEPLAAALIELGSQVERLVDPARASRVRSPVCFEDQLADTLAVNGRKAVGCAQTRRRRAVLVHAAVLLGLDHELYGQVFKVDPRRIRAHLAPALEGRPASEVAATVIGYLGRWLDCEPLERSRPTLGPRFLAPYDEPRWAPVR